MSKTARPVRCLDTGEVFKSARAAALSLGVTPANIAHACRGNQSTACGKRWEFMPCKIAAPQGEKEAARTWTLCWDCYRADHWADDPTPCSWAKAGQPVDGWTATETGKSDGIKSYFVHECPLFESDDRRLAERKQRKEKREESERDKRKAKSL